MTKVVHYLATQCWNSVHIHNNSVLHYLYNTAVGLVMYSKARALKAKAKARESQGQEIWP